MTKSEMTKYLLSVLAEKKQAYLAAKQKYVRAGHMERISMAMKLERTQDAFYGFWMICNDLGIVDPRS